LQVYLDEMVTKTSLFYFLVICKVKNSVCLSCTTEFLFVSRLEKHFFDRMYLPFKNAFPISFLFEDSTLLLADDRWSVRVISKDQIYRDIGWKMSRFLCWMLSGLFLVVPVTSTALRV
jgi:hypothetical protein